MSISNRVPTAAKQFAREPNAPSASVQEARRKVSEIKDGLVIVDTATEAKRKVAGVKQRLGL